jgi:cytochrome P450
MNPVSFKARSALPCGARVPADLTRPDNQPHHPRQLAPTGGGRRLGRDVRLADLAVDPYPILARLRQDEPVSWIDEAQMWFVTRRADVVSVLRDPETFRTDSPHSTIRDTFGEQMLSAEGEQHRRYKSQCNAPFNARSVREHAVPLTTAKVTALAAVFNGRPTVDLRAEMTRELAVYMVGTVLGIPDPLHGAIHQWYVDFAAALANFSWDAAVRSRGHTAVQEFRRTIVPVMRELAHGSSPSLLAVLSRDTTTDRLSDDEIIANALIVLFGGIETTESTILNVIWTLMHHPEALAAVRRDRTLLTRAVEEAMRWEPAVQSCTRHAARDVAFGGAAIASGDTVQCMLGAANRDPAHFNDPDRYDLTRSNAGDHLSFGSGKHFCLGAALARAEVQIVLDFLLDHYPALRADPERPSAPYGYEFRSPPELWVDLRG